MWSIAFPQLSNWRMLCHNLSLCFFYHWTCTVQWDSMSIVPRHHWLPAPPSICLLETLFKFLESLSGLRTMLYPCNGRTHCWTTAKNPQPYFKCPASSWVQYYFFFKLMKTVYSASPALECTFSASFPYLILKAVSKSRLITEGKTIAYNHLEMILVWLFTYRYTCVNLHVNLSKKMWLIVSKQNTSKPRLIKRSSRIVCNSLRIHGIENVSATLKTVWLF